MGQLVAWGSIKHTGHHRGAGMQLNFISQAVSTRLHKSPPWLLNGYAIIAAFSAYFCMYAFRKPFTAATYEGVIGVEQGFSLKTAFVISQIIGYAFSKYLGTRLLPEVPTYKRPHTILGLIFASWIALLSFAMGQPWFQMFALFLNGLCLGMIWGLVVGFLEGRRTSELLLAGLSCSFIVASGVVKDVGRYLVRELSISEYWMPFVVGALFIPPLVFSVWALAQLPPPTTADEDERHVRTRMLRSERHAFLKEYWPALVLSLTAYLFLTAFRDYRDNYGVELFTELGYASEPALFTISEISVALGVMAVLSLLSLVRDNQRALTLMFFFMSAGLLSLSLATLLLKSGIISGLTWMVLIGLGTYLTYVPFGSMLFERIMAHRRATGTAVFGIYLADSLGYTGSVGVQIYADIFSRATSRLDFFIGFTHALSFGGAALLALSAVLWLRSRSALQ